MILIHIPANIPINIKMLILGCHACPLDHLWTFTAANHLNRNTAHHHLILLQYILYVLDPEPELFALAAVHAFGRYGYNTGDDPDASILRKCAIVGVGHVPTAYEA